MFEDFTIQRRQDKEKKTAWLKFISTLDEVKELEKEEEERERQLQTMREDKEHQRLMKFKKCKKAQSKIRKRNFLRSQEMKVRNLEQLKNLKRMQIQK